MKPVNVDARRYAWCRGHALWIIGMPTNIFLEDIEGARRADQDGLLRYCARMIGDACAVALNVGLNCARPIPPASMRSSWALEGLEGHELRQPCWELIRGVDDLPAGEVLDRCQALVREVCAVIGEMPNILTPEGHYPAIALARSWINLMEAVGEKAPLPYNWTLTGS